MFKRNQRNSGVLSEAVFSVTGVPDDRPGGPSAFLLQNSPNPVTRSSTSIRYRIPEGPAFQRVQLRIFDANGRLVRTLVDGEQPPGFHELAWDGRDAAGRAVASGIYPYRLQVAGESFTRKMVVLK